MVTIALCPISSNLAESAHGHETSSIEDEVDLGFCESNSIIGTHAYILPYGECVQAHPPTTRWIWSSVRP